MFWKSFSSCQPPGPRTRSLLCSAFTSLSKAPAPTLAPSAMPPQPSFHDPRFCLGSRAPVCAPSHLAPVSKFTGSAECPGSRDRVAFPFLPLPRVKSGQGMGRRWNKRMETLASRRERESGSNSESLQALPRLFLQDSCKREAAHKITGGETDTMSPSWTWQDIFRLQTGANDLHPSDFRETQGCYSSIHGVN